MERLHSNRFKADLSVKKALLNKSLDYTNWAEGEPNNALDGEDCVAFTAWNGKWNDDNCNSKFNYICEIYDQLVSRAKRLIYFEVSIVKRSIFSP